MDHDDRRVEVPRRVRRVLTLVAGAIAVATLLGLAVLWPRSEVETSEVVDLASEVYGAKVSEVRERPCPGTESSDLEVRCTTARFRLEQGPDAGEERTLDFPDSPTTPDLAEGDRIVLYYDADAPAESQYRYADRQRRPVLWALVALFVLAVIALGRWQGLAALAGLGASIAVVLWFVVPAIADGRSPVWVAVVASLAIALVALYLAHGFRVSTTIALFGTLASLTVTVVLAGVFSALARFSGLATEEAAVASLGDADLSLSGLVLAGMVIGALGALDDMTVTQTSVVAELRAADPRRSRRDLVRAGMRVGRDHVASTVNTLALAYAGAALPLLIVFTQSHQSLGALANSELVAIEIVRTLVGSIGLVAAVPLTTLLAAWVLTASERAPESPPRVDAPIGDEDFWQR